MCRPTCSPHENAVVFVSPPPPPCSPSHLDHASPWNPEIFTWCKVSRFKQEQHVSLILVSYLPPVWKCYPDLAVSPPPLLIHIPFQMFLVFPRHLVNSSADRRPSSLFESLLTLWGLCSDRDETPGPRALFIKYILYSMAWWSNSSVTWIIMSPW